MAGLVPAIKPSTGAPAVGWILGTSPRTTSGENRALPRATSQSTASVMPTGSLSLIPLSHAAERNGERVRVRGRSLL
jgi:hypothetical protein